MFKILTYVVLSYFFYRYFIKPILPTIPQEKTNYSNDRKRDTKIRHQNQKRSNEGEYVDYEEVD